MGYTTTHVPSPEKSSSRKLARTPEKPPADNAVSRDLGSSQPHFLAAFNSLLSIQDRIQDLKEPPKAADQKPEVMYKVNNMHPAGKELRPRKAKLPLVLVVSGVLIFIGDAIFVARVTWERTVWTWQRGPQMVGFSLAHGSYAFLYLFPFLHVVWMMVVISLTIVSWIRKRQVAKARWIGLALMVSLVGVESLPWGEIFIGRMVASPRAGDILMYAAASGDRTFVRALVSHGVPVDATDRFEWKTALHSAAATGDLPTIRYLISEGANVNALDRAGDSPLELATSREHGEAVDFLKAHGAKRIQGDADQYQKALDDSVREEIEEGEQKRESSR